MEPCIEIDPGKFVIVVGPRFTATVLSELTANRGLGCDHKGPVLAYKDIVNEGITLLLQTETFQNDGEKNKYETLYRNAYELDPIFALRKVAVNLKKSNRYQEWLNRLFGWRVEHSLQASSSLQHLLDLQRNGALLIYTYCDDLLAQTAELQPVLLKDAEKWSAGECPGFLHVHGVLSEPGTVNLDCDLYETIAHSSHQAAAGVLKAVFQKRHAVVVGFDASVEDPLQSKFMEMFVDGKESRHTFVLDQATPPSGLPLILSSSSFSVPLASAISVTAESSWLLWKQIEFPNDNSETDQTLGLLVAGKGGATEISKMMFKAPGVNFALVSSITYGAHVIHTVCIRVCSLQLKELWQWIFMTENGSLLSKGLLAVVMETGTFVWLRGKPMSVGGKLLSNTTFAAALSSSSGTHKQPSEKEVAMETTHSETNGSMKAILSQKPGHSNRSTRNHGRPVSPFTTQEWSSIPKGKKIPRYTVHKFKVKAGGTNGVSTLLRQRNEFTDDSGILGVPKSVLNRRPSLPPMKPTQIPCREQSSVLGKLAENLENGVLSNADANPPSYTAIKRALLADSYRRRQSVQIDPTTLKNLLQSKLASLEESALRRDLLSQRRNSDPGIYWKQRDFERRKELFVDENESWSRNYGKVIDKKIVVWQKKRHERRQREFLRQQVELNPNNQNGTLNFHILNPLTTQGMATPYQTEVKAIPTASNGIPQASFVQPTSYLSGVNPYLYQQSLFTPTAASVSTASMVYSPFVSPYNFVNPYSMPLANSQPTTYLIQQPSPTATPQKVFYFVPSSTNMTVTTSQTGYSLPPNTTTMPQLSSLIAPSPAHTHTSPTNTQHEIHVQDTRTESNFSPKNRKRKHTLPEKLSTLLQHQVDEDPESPTSPKKCKLISNFQTTHSPPHSQSASVLERHLLQPSREQNGHRGDSEDREAEEIVGGAPYSPAGRKEDPPVVPPPHSQLQLWQFLLELLLISANSHLIQWTDNNLEFQINRPSEIALLWGKCTNNPSMNYEKLARGLRYYYSRGIMSKVPGKRLTFQYAGNVQNYVQLRRSQTVGSTEKVVVVE